MLVLTSDLRVRGLLARADVNQCEERHSLSNPDDADEICQVPQNQGLLQPTYLAEPKPERVELALGASAGAD